MTAYNKCKKCKTIHHCCYHSTLVITDEGKMYNIVLKNHPCKFFNIENNKCLVYKNRYKLNPYCLRIKDAIRLNGLPADCLYVKNIKGYKEGMPKSLDIPDDLSDEQKKALERIEKMPKAEFRKRFLPLIL